MKRCFSALLAMALLCTGMLFPARAEQAEAVSENVDAVVGPAEYAGDNGLTMDEAEIPPEPAPAEEVTAAPAEEALSNYARVLPGGAAITADPLGAEVLGVAAQDSVVLVVEAGQPSRVALYTERGVLVGYADAAGLSALNAEQAAAYLDAISAGEVALYEDDLDAPMGPASFAFADETPEIPAEETPAGEPTEAEPADETPAGEPAEAEPAEGPADETPAGEPAGAEPAEEPAVEEPARDPEAPEAEPEDEISVLAAPEAGDAAEPEEAEAPGDDAQVGAPAAANAVQLPEAIEIGLKEKCALDVSALPKGSALPPLTWRSSNAKKVSVSADGTVTGLKRGTATVYARMESGYEAACRVTVRKAPGKVSLSPSRLTLAFGESAKPQVKLPKGTASAKLTYYGYDSAVVAVDEDGTITAVGAGSTTVKVKTYNKKKAKIKVKVLPEPASAGFTAEVYSVAVGFGADLDVLVLDAAGNATRASVAYSVYARSRNPGCIALDPATGAVTGVSEGQAIVTATLSNGIVCRCTVNVVSAPAEVVLNRETLTLSVKEVCSGLIATAVAPDNVGACADTVTWTSSNPKVAKVDRDGRVTGLKKGKCTITATVADKSASCKVTVKKAPKKISISPKVGVLSVGTTGTFKISFPKGTGSGVTFTSSDESIATVDRYTGLVTGISVGEVKITATTANGKTATATLTVKANPAQAMPAPGDKASAENAKKLEYVISVAKSKLGKPYVYGSFGPNSFDCSGFTTYCFRQINVELKHSAYTQGYDSSMLKLSKENLRRGDLVFFNTNDKDEDLSDHAGLYLGNGKFIHASSSAGKVVISSMATSGSYYDRTFSWGRRVLD